MDKKWRIRGEKKTKRKFSSNRADGRIIKNKRKRAKKSEKNWWIDWAKNPKKKKNRNRNIKERLKNAKKIKTKMTNNWERNGQKNYKKNVGESKKKQQKYFWHSGFFPAVFSSRIFSCKYLASWIFSGIQNFFKTSLSFQNFFSFRNFFISWKKNSISF